MAQRNVWNLVKGAFTKALERWNLEPDSKQYPMSGGRRSVPTTSGVDGVLGQDLERVRNDIPQSIYDLLEILAQTNPDLSMAVENIVQLGNRPFTISFDEGISDGDSAELSQHIYKVSDYWYDNSGGLNSLRNDLFAQIAVTGALSAEIIPKDDLTGIKEIVLVSPKTIVFKYDRDKGTYYPYQDATRVSTGVIASAKIGLIELNPLTYKYYSIRRFGDKPYAVPPFLSALRSIAKEDQMLDAFDNVLKRYGVLGFLTIAVKAPKPRPKESEDSYHRRTKNYLEDLDKEVEKGMEKGYVIGFKDQHEFNLAANNANISGAKDLFEMNTQLKHSGLKQDPLMFGRNFSTTEALGRVVLSKLGANVQNYQKLVDTFLAYCIKMEAMMQGYAVKWVDVKSDKPLIADEVKEQDAMSKKIDNAEKLYQSGVIDQQEKANLLGYDEPAEDEPRTQAQPQTEEENEPEDEETDGNEEETGDPTDTEGNQDEESNMRLTRFDYGHVHGRLQESLASFRNTKFGKMVARYIELYLNETDVNYKKAIDQASVRIGNILLSMSENSAEQEVVDAVIGSLFSNWASDFSDEQRQITEKWVEEAYRFFRTDASILEGIAADELPDFVFNTLDFRALDFYKQSDSHFLGRFITDPDTKRKMTEYIKDKYLNGDTPIGRNSGAMKQFREEFADVLKDEDWKVERIIATTVNRMRNTAAINMMDEAEVEMYEIRGVNDSKQCDWCSGMQGKRFSVAKERGRLSAALATDPRVVADTTPFLTSVFKRESGESDAQLRERIRNTDARDFEDRGVAPPPYHPFCRDVVLAVL